MKMKSVMMHQFSQVPKAEIQRSQFDRSHGYKTAFDAGYLIPIFVDEALPGDTFNCNLTAIARLSTPLKPVMDNMFLETFFFAVPNRLLWDNWQKFNGEQDNPADSTDFLVPVLTANETGHAAESVPDYMGMPTEAPFIDSVAFYTRAYNLIWNEWFRDENLQDSVVVDTDDGPDLFSDYEPLLKRGKRHDYFTSCLPWPQKGTEVAIPLGTVAPVTGIGATTATDPFTAAAATGVNVTGGGTASYANATEVGQDKRNIIFEEDPANAGHPNVYADLSSATAATINQLRESFQIQKLYERDARGGTRYTEIIKSHFGVTSPDHRLQRPEYLGGGSTPINVQQVESTGWTGDPAQPGPIGDLGAFGTGHVQGHSFTKSFTEHCVLIGLACVRADITYQQGMDRMFSRLTRWDYYWPALAHLGEQEVLNKEIFADGGANDDLIFGYQERYAEYRYKQSRITGRMRSTFAPGPLDIWHLSQDFATLPPLNASFIEEDPPVDRIIAVPTEKHFIFDGYFKLKCARPMPTYGVPGLIDHF